MSPITAFLLPFHALPRLFAPDLRRFVLVPLALNVLVFIALAWVGVHYFDQLVQVWLPEDAWWSFLRWLVWPMFVLAYVLLLFYGFTIIGNLLAAPFNAVLATHAEKARTGEFPKCAELSVARAVGGAVTGELQKLWYLLARALPLLLLNGIALVILPLLLPLTSLLWILFGFWFLAVEYGDFPMGNHDLRPGDQISRLRRKRLQSLAFGAGVTVLMLVPFVQLLAIPAAVVGATRFWVDSLASADG